MDKAERLKRAEAVLDAYEATHERDPSDSPFAHYAKALMWLQTPEGWQAFKDAFAERTR